MIGSVKCSDYPLFYRAWVKARSYGGQKTLALACGELAYSL